MKENCFNCKYCGTFDCEYYGDGTKGLEVYEEKDSPCRYFRDYYDDDDE